MRQNSPTKSLLLVALISAMAFTSGCKKDQLTTSTPKLQVPDANMAQSLVGGVDPGIDDRVYDGWVNAYLIRSGGQTYFCNSLTDRERAFMWEQAYMITGVEDFYDKTKRADAKQLITDLLN